MEKPLVDVFIPVAASHAHVLPAAIYSALTQTYRRVRVVLFLDGIHDRLEKAVLKWFYTEEEARNYKRLHQIAGKNILHYPDIHYEVCKRGMIIRNTSGPAGSAHVGRQWLFEWPDKSPLVKMLDADDILPPRCLEIMVPYIKPDMDGVFCPIVRSSSYRFAEIISGKPQPGGFGSGAMLLRKEFMDRMIQDGFKWPSIRGHDKGFADYLVAHKETKIGTTKENFMYFYLK